MKDIFDLFLAACVVAVILGIWMAAPIIAFLLGTGFALFFIFAALKEDRQEKERERREGKNPAE